MTARDWDLFVIGGGSGGVRAARTAAGFGARVALAEVLHLGGTCVNVGCVPKKLLVHASHHGEALREAHGFGWSLSGELDWGALIHNKNVEIERLNGIYGRILDQAGVHVIQGRATVIDPHTVQVGEERFTAEHILVATGSRPWVPPVPGREHGCTSNEVFFLDHLPREVLIVGGGYIGVEFAGIFHGCGSQVTLVHNHHRLLNHFDADLGEHLGQEYARKGIELCMGCHVTALHDLGGGRLRAEFSDADTREADLVLFATGRRPNTSYLGLEEAGVVLDRWGGVVVDAGCTSSVPSIHAVGDVKDGPELTPVALAEGMLVARRLFGGETEAMLDYTNIPTAVFSQPAVASVGLSESQARALVGEVDIYRSSFTPMQHTLTKTGEKSLMKLVVARTDQRVVGLHLVAPDAAEIVQGFAVAMKMGATKQDFDATIGLHPTVAEELVTMRTKAG